MPLHPLVSEIASIARSTQNIHLSIVDIDEGFCRVLYKYTAQHTKTPYYYCLQEDWASYINLYKCTLPPWCEPSHKPKFKEGVTLTFERPHGDSRLVVAVNKWIDAYYATGIIDTNAQE
jgi:hypothetical protein